MISKLQCKILIKTFQRDVIVVLCNFPKLHIRHICLLIYSISEFHSSFLEIVCNLHIVTLIYMLQVLCKQFCIDNHLESQGRGTNIRIEYTEFSRGRHLLLQEQKQTHIVENDTRNILSNTIMNSK